MVTIITMGSSCFGSMALKSWSMKVIGGILLGALVYVWYTTCTFLKCFLLTEAEEPPPTNPPAMVLMTFRTGVLLRPLHLRDLERFVLCLHSSSRGLLLGLLPLWLLRSECGVLPHTNLLRCLA